MKPPTLNKVLWVFYVVCFSVSFRLCCCVMSCLFRFVFVPCVAYVVVSFMSFFLVLSFLLFVSLAFYVVCVGGCGGGCLGGFMCRCVVVYVVCVAYFVLYHFICLQTPNEKPPTLLMGFVVSFLFTSLFVSSLQTI